MSLVDGLRHRLRALLHGEAHARELREEVEFHLSLDAMQRAHAAHGALSADDARFAARRRFGNVTIQQEEARRMVGLGFFDLARQDARFAVRSFRRTPAFTGVALLTLAIGIGANTAIFSAVNALLLRPLPFEHPERLMKVGLTVPPRGSNPAIADMVWSYPKFSAFRDAQTIFSDLTLTGDAQFTIRGGGEAERTWGEFTDARYLPTLGIRAAVGRNFLPEEDRQPGGPRVVLLSDAFWKRRFNADSGIAGKALDVNGKPFTIVGVLPAGFSGVSGRADILVPILSQSPEDVNEAWSHSFTLIARLRAGVMPEQAKAVVRQLGRTVDAAYPPPEIKGEHWGAEARELDTTRVDPVVRRSLLVLLGAVGLVLLIACANVANLFLVRAEGRRREIGVRLAVGAGRGRLVRQLLTESILLSAAGGVAGLLLAWWGVKLLASLDPAKTLRIRQIEGMGAVSFSSIHLDLTALAFAAGLTLLTGVLFGLVPALQATQPSLQAALKDAERHDGGRRRFASRNVLAVAEIALAMVLLAGSGLMLRSLGKLIAVNPGVDAEQVLSLRLNTPEDFARDSLPGFYDRLLERLATLPGVRGVAMQDCPPLNGGCNGTAIFFRDRPPVAAGMETSVGIHWVTPDWSSVLRVPLIAGRFLTSSDRMDKQKVVVVSEQAAKRFWPGENAIGRPVSVGQGGFWKDTAYVVGVVGDVRYGTVDSIPTPDVYLSYFQSPRGRMMIFVRTTGDPMAITSEARRAMHDLVPDGPVYDVRPMASRVADATAYARFSTLLLVLFGVVALALATVGTYGVISFAVAQRTREIGIRVALGAGSGRVQRLVVQQGLRIAAAGAAVGVAAALLATRVLRSLLYDVEPSDPATFVAIVVLLTVAVTAASWIPARRAAGVEPLEALREG